MPREAAIIDTAIIEAESDESFFSDLEKTAKGLSVVTDRSSAEELRRLFSQLQHEDRTSADIEPRDPAEPIVD